LNFSFNCFETSLGIDKRRHWAFSR